MADGPQVGEPAPDFTLPGIENGERRDFTLSEYRGRKVALVHDWCPSFRGGERVLAELGGMFEGAEIHTLFDFLDKHVKDEHFPGVPFHTSIASKSKSSGSVPAGSSSSSAVAAACPVSGS